MTEDQIKHMADRFLGWKLPENFNPDCGISFKQTYNEHMPFGPMKHEPIGTNLFDAEQATATVRYMVEGLPSAPQGQWQPIETAPKDGTEFLAWTEGHTFLCVWDAERYSKKPRPYWRLRTGLGTSFSRAHQPSHWHPLPSPPATGDQ